MSQLPSITAITVTYGRHKHVQSALACFLNQNYEGRKKLIILNSFPSQHFVFEHRDVQIVNLKERPKSLGALRNIAIDLIDGDDTWALTFDDDDGYTSNHLSNFGRNIEAGMDWLWLSSEIYLEGYRPKGIVQGTPNTFAFTKRAIKAVGGYPSKDCGEDRAALGLITEKFSGRRITLPNHEISYCRNWGLPDVYHVSGMGDDTADRPSGHDRVGKWASERLGSSLIPCGEIRLEPKLLANYDELVLNFTRGVSKVNDSKMGKVGVVLLGRFGDCINILPVLKHIAERYDKPYFFISREFAHVLEGVSYCTPMPLDLPYDHVLDAIKVAQHKCELVLIAQIYGKDFNPEH